MKLRGHHLVCLHFFRGEGYSADFVAGLYDLLDKAEKGEEIEVVDSADDVCTRCPHLRGTVCHYEPDFEAEINEMDRAAFDLLKTSPGSKIKWNTIAVALPQIFTEWSRRYCGDCDWREACRQSPLWSEIGPGDSNPASR